MNETIKKLDNDFEVEYNLDILRTEKERLAMRLNKVETAIRHLERRKCA